MGFRRWFTALVARDPRPDARTKADVLDALGGEGCPVCRTTQQAARRWFFAYENDTRVDLAVRARLESSFGFCAPHSRHLLDLGASTSWLSRWVFADVARAGTRVLAAGQPVTPATCPTCESAGRAADDALGELAVGLADAGVRQLLEAGDGLCVTHGLAVIERGGVAAGRAVATMLESRLGKDPVTARDHLVGTDPDIARRRRMREARAFEVLAAEEAARARPLGDVDLVLDWPCCPLCAAADRVEWRYLHYLAGLGPSDAAELRTDATLCVRHLGDLANLRHTGDGSGLELTDDGLLVPVAAVLEHVAGLWRKDLQTYLQRLDAASWSAGAATVPVRRGTGCQLCTHRDAAVERTSRLLGLVAADPAYGERLATAHGPCLRHGLSMRLPDPWKRLQQARTGLLSYELDEAERKSRWDARWEVRGAEMSSWRRAPTILDGAVLGPLAPGDSP